jgi:cytochrome c oxidase subunit 6b
MGGGDSIKMNKIFSEPMPELNKEEAAMLKMVENVRTTPRDPRFPSANQAGHCWNRYNEWLNCLKQTGNDEEGCKMMRQYADSICPSLWLDKWDEERDEGTFAGLKV